MTDCRRLLDAGGKTVDKNRNRDEDGDVDGEEDDDGTERNEWHVNVIQVAWAISAAQSVALICVSVRYSLHFRSLLITVPSQFAVVPFYLPLM